MNKSEYTRSYKFLLERLKAARAEACLQPADVAKKLNCALSYITKVESGQQKLDVIQFKELADMYNKDLNYFLAYTPPTESEKKQNVEEAKIGIGKKKPRKKTIKKIKKVGAKIKDFFIADNKK